MTDFNGADPAAFDHDGDGQPGGSVKRGRPPKVDQNVINDELRKKAARQAAKTAEELKAPTIVECRVLKNGDGKISTGQHVAGIGEVHYDKGETFKAELSIANELETRGYVEIQ